MLYTGDTHVFILSLTHPDGTTPVVTTAPMLQIVNASTGSPVLGSAATMTVMAGTVLIYTYNWFIPTDGSITNGDYFAIVSYVVDEITVSNRFLESFRIGDSYINGPVALNLTCAKEATVAKDSTVAHLSDLSAISPDNSTAIDAIRSQTNLIPSNPALASAVLDISNMLTTLTNYTMGSIVINRASIPKTMTIYSYPDNTALATFNLVDESNQSGKNRTS